MQTIKCFLGLFVITALSSLPAFSQDPAEIISEMEEVMRGNSSYAEMTMTIERPRYTREVSMRSWLLGTDYSMIIITAPARDEGTAYLMREDNIWQFDPRIDRVTRLPSSMMSESWMGSDFTNDDLVRDSDPAGDFEHEILRTEEYNGRQCYVIELIPKPDVPVVWGKIKMWISTEDKLQLRSEFYDQSNELVNTMKLDQIKHFDGREIPSRFTMIPADEENERTILIYEKMEFDIDIKKDFFTRDNMQRDH